MSETASSPQPLTLWLFDRSRYEDGLSFCQMARFLGYHFGPTGYGIKKKAEKLPLATGIAIHAVQDKLLCILRDEDRLPTEAEIRAAATLAVTQYREKIEKGGFLYDEEDLRRQDTLEEQCALITGLAWGFSQTLLPWMHQDYVVVHVEREENNVLGCTCGLGDSILEPADHAARECHGLVQMMKMDCLAKHRLSGTYTYFESKSTGDASDAWASGWETKLQLSLNIAAAQARHNIQIEQSYILAWIKGKREAAKRGEVTPENPVIQKSPFCVGYYNPGNPPVEAPDWQAQYEWVDDWGKNRKLGPKYQRTSIWGDEFRQTFGVVENPAEHWFRLLPQDLVEKQFRAVGPLNRQDLILGEILIEAAFHEQDWARKVWRLYEVLQGSEGDWSSAAYQQMLREEIPRSWQCMKFGKRHGCQFLPLCKKQQGWEHPEDIGFVPRVPHHELEREQMRSVLAQAGMDLPEDLGEDDDD